MRIQKPVSADRPLWADRKGQGLTEYLILMILVCLVSVAAVRTMGSTIREKVEGIQRHVEGVKLPER